MVTTYNFTLIDFNNRFSLPTVVSLAAADVGNRLRIAGLPRQKRRLHRKPIPSGRGFERNSQGSRALE